MIDAQGNIVSNTYTLNNFYGSQVIPKGTGVLMNDIIGSLSQRPGDRDPLDPPQGPQLL